MAISAFSRAARRVLARLGEDSFLRGAPAGKVDIEHGVQFTGYDGGYATAHGDVAYVRSVATILSSYNPKVGDALVHPDGGFVLDVLVDEDGYSRRYTLRPTS
jgi:hypothetical protein